ncbi:FAST kinase domain-containing protein 4 [Cimex lectularius]|uniref:RAP domain-containing protein n=1 Tax=Cimex lectularius TaxID=79782 RepID=A0A8I6S363_CIMLE|nr:FAST kinase domain-containing protein 4 [Cimex lectularius]
MLRSVVLGCGAKVLKQVRRPSSASSVAVPSDETRKEPAKTQGDATPPAANSHKSQMIKAAFSSLKHNFNSVDEKILEANTPDELLVLAQDQNLTREQALRIVTTLAEWSVNGQADMSKFETDPRFVSLCQLLGRTSRILPSQVMNKHGDISVILGVTGEDEAAKLVASITLPQMVKVLSSLANKRRRSVPLLRSLAFNIERYPIKLDIKQASDVLYSLALLHYPDEVLLEKVTSDLLESIPSCQKPSVISSICTSYGLLKYKDLELLDTLSEWVLKNKDKCRNQEIVSLLLTLATVNHTPAVADKFFEELVPSLTIQDLPSSLVWLDFVWALTVLGHATPEHFKSILCEQFAQKLITCQTSENNYSWKKKILNINGVARLNKEYKGPNLDSRDFTFPMVRNKEKQALFNSVMDALSNILPSSTFLRTNVDTGMGFMIDGECLIDEKMTPLPVVDKKTGQPLSVPKASKIAIMVWDYHDKTKGRVTTLNGLSALSSQLLISMGYKILSVPYSDYNPREKLTLRVQYLERQIKSIVQSSS